MRVANGTRNEHRAVLQLIRENMADFEEFGGVAFEVEPFDTAGGVQHRRVAILNEEHATLLLTYMRNNEVVKDFKKRLVREFAALRRAASEVRPLTPLEYARKLVDAEERVEAATTRAEQAEQRAEIESRHRRAIEGGDGILLTDFGKKYFSEVRHTDFFEHLYAKKWLIDQRGGRVLPNGDVRNGHDHGKPTYKGRPFIYEHDTGNHGGKRRFQPRVRPQREIEFRDALAAEGLPVNTHSTGLVLISNDELKAVSS
ncbi:Rha family transcriptional regulator [Mycobacterium sp. CVI_P3]|nr:Rha family transcriptional regulator [Mycobacterium pinniadriaticum]MCX2931347.1 Rha family transcriptional regulator [Mycobacterium pinniadriaticum]